MRTYALVALACGMLAMASTARAQQYPAWTVSVQPALLKSVNFEEVHKDTHGLVHKRAAIASVRPQPIRRADAQASVSNPGRDKAIYAARFGTSYAASYALPQLYVAGDMACGLWEAGLKNAPDPVTGFLNCLFGLSEINAAQPKDRCWIFTKRFWIGHASVIAGLASAPIGVGLGLMAVGFLPDKVLDQFRQLAVLCNVPPFNGQVLQASAGQGLRWTYASRR